MKRVSLENNGIMLRVPLEMKKQLYEMSLKEGMTLTGYVIQILWRWIREQGDDTKNTA